MSAAPPAGGTPVPTYGPRVAFLSVLGYVVLRLLGHTWRIEFRGGARWAADTAAGRGTMLVLWHGHLLPLAFAMRGRGITVLTSEHRDAEIISRVIHRLGYRTIRGSSSRGGSRALIGIVRLLEAGHTVGVTPDGPRGPARTMAPGALYAAQRAAATVTPLFVTASRAWRMRSWDAMMIPKPFARVTIHIGDPERIPAGAPLEAVSADVAARIGPLGEGA